MKKSILLLISALFVNACSIDSQLTVNKGQDKAQNVSDSQKATNDSEPAKLSNLPVSQVQAIPDTLVITEGNKVKANASVIYSDNTRSSDLVWTSSDNTIAVVNSTTGEISGVKSGIVTILATAQRDSSKKTSITVTVKRADVTEALTKITPTEATIKIGETTRLSAQIQLSDGSTSPNVIWTSDNKSIALISNGVVTGISEGTTTITAIAEGDSTKKASATITVVKTMPAQASSSTEKSSSESK